MSDKHRTDIDGLRAIAVLMVLVFHFDLLPFGRAGFTGVDVFYVISGFLITSIVNRQLDAGQFSIKNFYLSRIRRLAPALFVTLILVMIGGLICLFPLDLLSLTKEILAAQTYVANIYYWRTVNYFGLSVSSAFLLHTWSLAVEEQFYLIYPLCLLLVHRYFRRYLWPIIFMAMILSFCSNLAFVASKPQATFYLLPTRAWELLIGAMILPALSRIPGQRRYAEAAGLAGLTAIAIGFVTYDRSIYFPGWFALLPTLGAALALWSGTIANTITNRALSNRFLGYAGLVSYPLYLVHWPIAIFASRLLGGDYGLAWRTSMMVLSFGVASFIYHFIEQPVRDRRLLVSGNRLIAGYAAGLFITVASTVLVFATHGMPQRYPTEVVRLASFSDDKLGEMKECDYEGKALEQNSDFCSIGKIDLEPQWLVYGDSHAWAAHDVFDKWLRERGESGLFIFRHGCPPLTDVHMFQDQGKCFSFNANVLAFLRDAKGIKNVVLVSTWRQAIEGLLSSSEDSQSTVEESTKLFGNTFSETIHRINALGKQIFVWEPLPGAKQSVPQTLAEDALKNRHTDIEFSKAEYLSTYAFFFEALAENRAFISHVFSPSKALCFSGACAVVANGIPLYFDNGHITKSSTEFWIDKVMDAN